MFQVQIDEQHIDEILRTEIQKRLDEVQVKYTFWDMKDLCEQTRLSENTIKDKFFYDQRFPKFRIGKKWMFPAEQAKNFLLEWSKEQPTH